MPQPHPIFVLWPGLSGLIRHGRAPFLIVALGFGLIADLVLSFTGFWTEWLDPNARLYAWIGLTAVWGILSAVSGRLSLVFDRQAAFDREGDCFLRVLDDYLAGRWFEAEKKAESLLKQNRRDTEVLLLLATPRRHTGRFVEAAETLERLERLETAEKWIHEINLEQDALAEPDIEPTETTPDLDRDDGAILRFRHRPSPAHRHRSRNVQPRRIPEQAK